MQYCGFPGLSILDTVFKVRDILAHHETTDTPLWILTLDFHNAFYRVSYAYLFRNLRAYGISEWFIEGIQALYTDATASVQINGTVTRLISIKSGVRHLITDILPHLRIGQRMLYIPVLAYADDVTEFVTQPAAFTKSNKRYSATKEPRGTHKPTKIKNPGHWKMGGTCNSTKDRFPRSHQHTRRNI